MNALPFALAAAMSVAAPAPSAVDYAGDARALDDIVVANYAYEDHWPGGKLPASAALDAERAAVHDGKSLLHYAEHRIASLADHHAITGSSFKDSWAVVPTYADMWIERRGQDYVITSVRDGSPAQSAGILPGDLLAGVSGVPTAQAVEAFWRELGLSVTDERADYAARVLAAGSRDRPRNLTIRSANGTPSIDLPNLYAKAADRPPLSVTRSAARTVIRFNNSLGDQSTIAAFDGAMGTLPR